MWVSVYTYWLHPLECLGALKINKKLLLTRIITPCIYLQRDWSIDMYIIMPILSTNKIVHGRYTHLWNGKTYYASWFIQNCFHYWLWMYIGVKASPLLARNSWEYRFQTNYLPTITMNEKAPKPQFISNCSRRWCKIDTFQGCILAPGPHWPWPWAPG